MGTLYDLITIWSQLSISNSLLSSQRYYVGKEKEYILLYTVNVYTYVSLKWKKNIQREKNIFPK